MDQIRGIDYFLEEQVTLSKGNKQYVIEPRRIETEPTPKNKTIVSWGGFKYERTTGSNLLILIRKEDDTSVC